METRKITIVATREQKKYVIDSAATTLGELKADLDNVGINYEDMTFMEGLTRTEILRDDSLLPHDVERVNRETGETYITNELVFMLTNTAKKISSGVVCAPKPPISTPTNGIPDIPIFNTCGIANLRWDQRLWLSPVHAVVYFCEPL